MKAVFGEGIMPMDKKKTVQTQENKGKVEPVKKASSEKTQEDKIKTYITEYIDSYMNSVEELSIDEALELNEKVEKDGLLHIWQNNTSLVGPNVACQCCRDCCMSSVPLDIVEAPLEKRWQKSRFIARVDDEKCIGCQDCVERCHFDAIDMVKPEGAKKSKKLSRMRDISIAHILNFWLLIVY